jgi:hypothetical protein
MGACVISATYLGIHPLTVKGRTEICGGIRRHYRSSFTGRPGDALLPVIISYRVHGKIHPLGTGMLHSLASRPFLQEQCVEICPPSRLSIRRTAGP